MPTEITLTDVTTSSTLPPKSSHSSRHLLTSSLETAWYSKNLPPPSPTSPTPKHVITLTWSGSKTLVALGLMFQGGFVGKGGKLSYLNSSAPLSTVDPPLDIYSEYDGDYEPIDTWGEFEDTNDMQIIGVEEGGGEGEGIRIELDEGTDFYKRVIIYRVVCWEK
ncbi:hypothetical protein TrST_g686 [Triparma strigata]|uniref:Uncharacterized protein n=1 Tax=Triparma strigata TaxID=1606541 RepID=A0A9W7A523_9STRA|nr:hypothetical protein TrST_g686 [Triparma strigata]